MSETPDHDHVSAEHLATLDHLLRHPTTHNLSWTDVIGAVREVATVEDRGQEQFKVHLGNESVVIDKPKSGVVDNKTVLELRRVFKAAGHEVGE